MKTRRTPEKTRAPRIVHGARLLATCSVIWSGYAISDLMHSGPWGITVAIAGDIGWITVLWAEANRVRIWDRTWPAAAAGWLIAVGVGVLLAMHGTQGPDGSWAKAMAGVLVIAVSKIVWMFALAATVDRTALTPEQESEIDAVIRDSSYTAQLHEARADAEIARIRAEARTTLARDEADFEVTLERVRKRAELHRRTPLALPPASPAEPGGPGFDEVAEQAITTVGEPDHEQPNTITSNPSTVRDLIANKALNRPNADREQPNRLPNTEAPSSDLPSLADLVREQVRRTANNATAVREVLAIRPDANKDSVAAAVRRARRKIEMEGGYG